MIEENHNQWVICTPAKTGSYSLESTLITRLGIAHKYKENDRVGTLYEGKAKERILIVRHPLERWASMFWFAKQKKEDGRSIFLADFTIGLNVYADAWLEAKAEKEHPNFTATFTEMAKQFQPDLSFSTDKLNFLMRHLGLNVEVSHKNATREKKGWNETKVMMRSSLAAKIEKVYEDDFKNFKHNFKR